MSSIWVSWVDGDLDETRNRTMTSVGPINTSALQLLQQFSRPSTAKEPADTSTNILKSANGLSGEPSDGTKSAAAAIGKFTVDSAATTERVIIGDLGSFDSYEHAMEYVNRNETFSENDKKAWLDKITGFQRGAEAVDKFKASDLYKSFISGAHRAEVDAMKAAADKSGGVSVDTVMALNDLLAAEGRESLVDRMGEKGYNEFLNKIALRAQ